MQPGDLPQTSRGGSWLLRRLLLCVFADLALLLLTVYAHVITSDAFLLLPVAVLGVALVILSVAAIAAGLVFAWRSYPQHRRPIVFVVVITLATLLAHAYVIGLPQAATQASVSGAVNTTFGNQTDDKLSVSSTLSGQQLTITVTAMGNAVAAVNVSSGGQALQGPGFTEPPTYGFPLQPGSTASGVWRAPAAGSSARLDVTYQYLTCYSTDSRTYGCIMDEVFYVPEAMGILAGQHCSTGGANCHMEHPYFVPAMIAAGMSAFGQYNAVGWRVFPVLLGSFSIPLLFGIAWKASGSKKLAYLSAVLLSLDVMFFSQSSGALLDVPEAFFGLAAFFAYFAGLKFWKFDRYVIAGVLFGVAGLAKETAVFMALALVTYVVLFGDGSRWARAYSALKVVIVVGLVFAVGLQAYDTALASPAVPTFVQHVSYVLSYGSSLTANKLECQPTTGYWCKFANDPGGPPILPIDWLVYYSPISYYATSVTVCPNTVNGVCHGGQYSYVALAYYGVTNFLETWTVFIWGPIIAYTLYRWRRRPAGSLEQFGFEADGAGMLGEMKFAGLILIWFLWSYIPYVALFLAGRVTYPFYFVPAIPAVALGAAWWLTRDKFPRWLVWVYVGMVFVFFFVYFPEKAFLPDWLRVILRH